MAINDRRYRAGLLPDACCLLPDASSERGTVAINDRRYRAGLMPDAYCLFPVLYQETRKFAILVIVKQPGL